MRDFKLGMVLAGLLFIASPLFCSEHISDYAEQKIVEILTPYVVLGLQEDSQTALQKIDAWEAEVAQTLPTVANDLEQEQLIFQSLFLMERRHYLFDPVTKSPELYAKLKAQFKKNERWLSAHQGEKVNKWMILFTGDLTSCYMVRSLAATIGYGMHVKRLYEQALEVDRDFAYAYINLGVWRQYAPGIFGGGEKKAADSYIKAFACARTDTEKYIASLYISQYYFTIDDAQQCEAYLALAEDLFPESKEIPLIRKINSRGVSLFQFNREQSGFDENHDEEETDEA